LDASVVVSAAKLSLAKESGLAIRELSMQMMDIVREILQRLRPRAIDELGLELATKELIAHWKSRHKTIHISQIIPENLGVINEDTAITIYRLIQECLTNIAKHANAKRVIVKIVDESNFIVIDVEDDGVGFDMDNASDGYGLLGMKERVQGLGGVLDVNSSIGNGTRIFARIPKN